MTAWFSKLFKSDAEPGERSAPSGTGQLRSAAMTSGGGAPAPTYARPEPDLKLRRIVKPTVIDNPADGDAGDAGGIRIKAQYDALAHTCVFMVDRPVLQGHSAWFAMPQAAGDSPLAQAIFNVEGTDSVLIHGMNITVGRDPYVPGDWEDWARSIGARIREHLESGAPAVSPAFLESIPSEGEIADRIQRVLDQEINPGIAAHSGAIELERVDGNTVYIRMLGGCQGCAASTVTLRQGVHQAFREAVPQLGAILDQTDHAAGTNPYYRNLPGE